MGIIALPGSAGPDDQVANKAKLINLAQKSMSRGQWDKAIGVLEKVLAEDSSDVRSLLKLGDVYAKKGDRESASEVYQKVAEHHAQQGFFLKSVAVFKQILKLDAQNSDAALRIAELHEQLGLAQDALVHFQLALPLLEARGETDRTISVLERMLELDPENVAARIKLAETLSRAEDRPGAVRHFSAAASVLKQQVRIEDYVKVAERLVFHDPGRLDVVKDLAKLYLSRGDTKRGLAKLQICFRATPRDVETLTLLAKAFADLGQVQKTVFVYRELARVHQDEGRPAEAREIHRLILQHHPDDAEALRALGMIDTPLRGPSAAPSTNDVDIPVESAVDALPFSRGPVPHDATGALPLNASRDLHEPRVEAPLEVSYATGDLRPGDLSPGSDLDVPLTSSAFLAPSHAPRPKGPGTDDLVLEAPLTGEPLSDEPVEGEPIPGDPLREPPEHAENELDRIVREAEVYIRYNLPGKAIEHLQKAFQVDPQSVLVFRRIHQVYASMGDEARAAEAMANAMQLLEAEGDAAGAAEARETLERMAPGHPSLLGAPPRPAAELWTDPPPSDDDDFERELDAAEEDVDIDTGEFMVGDASHLQSSAPRGLPASAFSGAPLAAALGAPVGSRDLDELGASDPDSVAAFEISADQLEDARPDPDGFVPREAGSPPATPPPLPPIDAAVGEEPISGLRPAPDLADRDPWGPEDDDDFALEDVVAALAEGREGETDETASAPPEETAAAPPEETAAPPEETAAAPEETAAPPEETAAAPPDDDLADELEEIAFFIDAEIYDDAEEALLELERGAPGHAGVAAARARLESARGASGGATEPSPLPESSASYDPETEEALSFLGRASRPTSETGPRAAAIDEKYDEGMAFKQIGQLEEAANAFQDAAEASPERAADALEMLGLCLIELARPSEAIRAFEGALEQAPEGFFATNLRYELGDANERLGEFEAARTWFEACRSADPAHRDVELRLRALSRSESAPLEPETPDEAGGLPEKRSKISYL